MIENAPFRLRPALAADAEQLSALIVRAFSGYEIRLDPPSSALKETPAAVRAKFPAHGGAIAESKGAGIGCVLFVPEDTTALYVGRLAVDPAWRRRGVARALMSYAEAEARRRGFAQMRLQVRIPLLSNQALFRSCGFIEVRREAHPGYTEPTMIRMEKALS
jgi:ribosomal protein S18 acetylase RimI-like enzyme